ncbi:hypothetical protein BDV28DRAFT_65524 [Aspergillus coremiiformis]|uniref:Endo-1,3(4)-beta-glucanase n=1 Tax=Aspergillus coremiiformis TaxID=138285 RepID=A0A5N6ZGQ1_9EURO|nr:hypothetical protein BDV28DRAFT_65524 [Aspergillus coremiiformis]
MVLETPQTDPIPQTGNEPTSQGDIIPLTISDYSFNALVIKKDLYAKPGLFALYAGLLGRSNYHRKAEAEIRKRTENLSTIIQRPPTQEELDAIVTHASRRVYQARIGAPMGFFVGVATMSWQAQNSETFRRYFLSPGPDSKAPSESEIPRLVERFVASEAKLIKRTAFTAAAKLVGWTMAGWTLSGIYALYRETRDGVSDPRMQSIYTDIRKQDWREIERRKKEAWAQRSGVQQKGVVETEQHGDYGSEYAGGDGQPTRMSIPDRRPAVEPVGGTGVLGADDSRGAGFFDDDDASPTAPEYRTNKGSQGTQGSAWEQIRRENAASTPVQPSRQPATSPQSSEWDSWSFSSENEKQREREQARAEFERLLDAERDFGREPATEGRNGRWGKWN